MRLGHSPKIKRVVGPFDDPASKESFSRCSWRAEHAQYARKNPKRTGSMSEWGNHVTSDISADPMMISDDSFRTDSVTGVHNLPGSDEAFDCSAESSDSNIAKKETREVYHLKIIVLSILFVSAIVTATCVYVFISKKEEGQCFEQFQSNAAKVLNAVGNSIDQTLIPLDSLAVDFVSYARDSNLPWPFVTLPEFGLRMSKSLPLTDAMMIQYLPLVEPWQRADWESYVGRNNGWVNETMKLQETWDGYYGPINYNWTANNIIFGDAGDIEANVSRPMAPAWEVFPIVVDNYYAYNWDWLSQVYSEQVYTCMNNHKAVMTDPYMIPRPDDLEGQAESEGLVGYFKHFLEPGVDPFQPVLDMLYPIVDDVSRIELLSSPDYDPSNHTLVGLVAVSIYWREIIRNVLSPGSSDVVIVIDNECTDSFTYRIVGPEVTYLGVLDHHNTKYDGFMVSTKVVDLHKFSFQEDVYSGAPIDKEYCPYTLRLYPSEDLKSNCTTNNALAYMLVALVSFAILALIFVAYDHRVEHRQKKVLSYAVRSSEIVSSLFPKSVQDQLYPTLTENDKRNTPSWPYHETHQEQTSTADGPIAKLYPETTVMFADIKGFTQWSASREPTDVFLLLETLYGAMDRNAKLYGIFKVETIGDTYVAVAGLPTARKHHAVAMAKFAKKCLITMTELAQDLVATLGPDTADLSLRIGLNSGPTTAGVLRGEKARFQLFGDTVNTASRMESTGESGKIQVSESTAALIRQASKGHWLLERSETVMAKGKGLMKTYWCNPSLRGNTTGISEASENEF